MLVVEIDSAPSTASFPERLRPGLSRGLAGGKGHSLAALARAGFTIPRTVVLTTRLFAAHVAATRAGPLFHGLTRSLAAGERPGSRELRAARRALEKAPLATRLREITRAVFEALLSASASGKIALRSSATGEDGGHATFAGLHDTFLAIGSVAEAERALRACWLSLLGDRALEYRARLRLRSPLAMAVVAQEHVDATAAGVAFSRVGRGDGARVVVELARPGESAPVTGAETPERFEVPRIPGGGGASRGDVRRAARPLARWLSADDATEVVRQALRAEAMLRAPADVEWLLARGEDGARVVVVQARPARVPRPPRFDRTAVAESLPHALTPLARDVVVEAYARGFETYLAGAPRALTDAILVYRGGRLFMDVPRLDRAIARAAGRRGRDARDTRARTATPGAARASERRLRALAREIEALRRRRAPAGATGRGVRGAPPRRGVARARGGAPGAEIGRAFDAARDELAALLPLYLLAQDDVGLIQTSIARTRAALERPLGTPPALDAGALDLARALARARRPLIERQWSHPAVRQLRFQFGHRGGVELDLASPPLGEDLEALAALASGTRASARRARRPESIPGFEHEALAGLLQHGREAAARADRLRDVITRAVRAARLAALAAGERLAAGSRATSSGEAHVESDRAPLATRDDVFFLERRELGALLRGEAVPHLALRIERRRRAFTAEQERAVPLATDHPERAASEPPGAPGGAGELRGIAASGGVARGPARVVLRPEDLRALEPREIIVAHAATAELFGALVGCAGLVTDVGGLLSHGAILARELGVPAVVATGDASRRIATGDLVVVDGERGSVHIRAPRLASAVPG